MVDVNPFPEKRESVRCAKLLHDYLVAVKRQQSFRLTAPPIPTTPRTFYQSQLPDFDTPTSDKRPDTPVTSSIQPVMSLILPTTPTAPTSTRSTNSRTFWYVMNQMLMNLICYLCLMGTERDMVTLRDDEQLFSIIGDCNAITGTLLDFVVPDGKGVRQKFKR
ncbi:Hypothetical predicted protein [Mytilus galloprovincialis]|uniref:Uncharacterized protein n=1 Tax=Mytilus galloprovincialis TaxID=29158 RepID=A0A8B6HPS2_MYTGA|nr:Hypothetical predicted protein [Mytilus galloprovincialis]